MCQDKGGGGDLAGGSSGKSLIADRLNARKHTLIGLSHTRGLAVSSHLVVQSCLVDINIDTVIFVIFALTFAVSKLCCPVSLPSNIPLCGKYESALGNLHSTPSHYRAHLVVNQAYIRAKSIANKTSHRQHERPWLGDGHCRHGEAAWRRGGCKKGRRGRGGSPAGTESMVVRFDC